MAACKETVSLDDLFRAAEEKGEPPFFVVCDGLEDPHNLGAILRTAEAAGAHGVVIPKRRSVGLTSTVYKASAGAVEYVPVARVTNITDAPAGDEEAGRVGIRPRHGRRKLVLRRLAGRGGCGGWLGRAGDRPSGQGAMRFCGVPSYGGADQLAERIGGVRHCAVRGGAAAAGDPGQVKGRMMAGAAQGRGRLERQGEDGEKTSLRH